MKMEVNDSELLDQQGNECMVGLIAVIINGGTELPAFGSGQQPRNGPVELHLGTNLWTTRSARNAGTH